MPGSKLPRTCASILAFPIEIKLLLKPLQVRLREGLRQPGLDRVDAANDDHIVRNNRLLRTAKWHERVLGVVVVMMMMMMMMMMTVMA